MDSVGCYLGVFLFLGALIGAFFAEGNARRRNAMAKINAMQTEKARAGEALAKAKTRRQQGVNELPGAFLLMVLAFLMLILTACVLATADTALF